MKNTIKNIMEEFDFDEISSEELLELRIKLSPVLILKVGKKLFIHRNEKNFKKILRIARRNQTHLCGVCNRLSALPESQGGCSRISDPYIQYPYPTHLPKSFLEDEDLGFFEDSSMIEKYPYVIFAIEVLSKKDISCPIFACTHFSPIHIPTKAEPNRMAIPKQNLNELYEYANLPSADDVHKKICEAVKHHS